MSIEIRETLTYARWFARLRDSNARARINVRIQRLLLGNPGDVRAVGEGVFARRGTTIVILLAGGDKSTQAKDIMEAKELMRGL
jgi:putative addiction module killer protein